MSLRDLLGKFVEFDEGQQPASQPHFVLPTPPPVPSAPPRTPVAPAATAPQPLQPQPLSQSDFPSSIRIPQSTRISSGPPPAPAPPAPAVPQDPVAGNELDFGAIYRQAGIPMLPFSSEQVARLLAGLPDDLPLDTKRQTVRAMMQATSGTALATTPEAVADDAARKIAALTSSMEEISRQVTDYAESMQAEITALQEQILVRRRAMEAAQLQQNTLISCCKTEIDRLTAVARFFDPTLGRSR